MAKSPKKLNIRTYHVGFGDCFLLSFEYGPNDEKHVLVDFGSTGLPDGTPKTRMMDIAKDIKARTGGKLTAVVATHRHKDHISGFETEGGRQGHRRRDQGPQAGTGHPALDGGSGPRNEGHRSGGPADGGRHTRLCRRSQFDAGRRVAGDGTDRTHATFLAGAPAAVLFPRREQHQESERRQEPDDDGQEEKLRLLRQESGPKSLLPGVDVDVLGPPTVKQTDSIKKQRSRDPDEFWHFWRFQAAAMLLAEPEGKGKEPAVLFPGHVRSKGPRFPVDVRWLVYHSRKSRGDQLLQIVRMLDKAMNNTSVILLFRVGKESLLFSGDAQIENWQYALSTRAGPQTAVGRQRLQGRTPRQPSTRPRNLSGACW